MMRSVGLGILLCIGIAGGGAAQELPAGATEVPLRLEDGRLVVTVENAYGEPLDFILSAAGSLVSTWGAEELGVGLEGATLGGLPISLAGAQVVPEKDLLLDGPFEGRIAGVLGGQSLMDYDILIDAPGRRLLLKRPGRFVEWEGVALTGAVRLQILHEYLIRTDVEVNGEIFSAHVDLSPATMIVSSVVRDRAGVRGGRADFRMGYASFPDRPAEFLDLPPLRAWGGDDAGVVFVGAPVAYDCAIAISWAHAEMRTCPR
jgi:hypothetical protein